MSDQLTRLQQLHDELHQIKLESVKAAEPLELLAELSPQERQQVADQIRARLAVWESVTHRISQVLAMGSSTNA